MKLHFLVLHPMLKCYQDLSKILNKILIKILSYLLIKVLIRCLQRFHQDLIQILPGCY